MLTICSLDFQCFLSRKVWGSSKLSGLATVGVFQMIKGQRRKATYFLSQRLRVNGSQDET